MKTPNQIYNWVKLTYSITKNLDVVPMLLKCATENACSLTDIYLSLKRINELKQNPRDLKADLILIGKLSNVGIIGYNAGVKIREYLLINEIINRD